MCVCVTLCGQSPILLSWVIRVTRGCAILVTFVLRAVRNTIEPPIKKIQMTAFWVKSQDQDQNSCQHNIAVKHSMHFENRCVSKNYAVKHYCRALPPDGSHAGFSQGRTLEKVHCSRLTLFHRVIIHCVELEMFMFHQQRIRTLCSALILFHGVRPC